MRDWYAIRNGQQFGPYSQLEVEQYFVEGRLTDSDQVWVPVWQRWAPGHEVRQTFFASQTSRKQPVSGQPRPKKKPVLLILILLSAASLIALTIHFWPDKNNRTAGTKTLGSLRVSSGGGSFEKDGLLIEIDGSAGQSSYMLDIFEMDAPTPQDPDLIDQSRTVVLEGDLSKLSGDMAVTLPIPENMLPKNAAAASDLAGKLLLSMEEDVFVPSLGQSTVKRVFLPATIDLEQKTISTTIRVQTQSAASLSAGPPQIGTTTTATADTAHPNEQIRLSILAHRYGYFTMTSQKGHFQVLAPAQVSQASASALLAELERQKQRIESIGFSFAKITPIRSMSIWKTWSRWASMRAASSPARAGS